MFGLFSMFLAVPLTLNDMHFDPVVLDTTVLRVSKTLSEIAL